MINLSELGPCANSSLIICAAHKLTQQWAPVVLMSLNFKLSRWECWHLYLSHFLKQRSIWMLSPPIRSALHANASLRATILATPPSAAYTWALHCWVAQSHAESWRHLCFSATIFHWVQYFDSTCILRLIYFNSTAASESPISPLIHFQPSISDSQHTTAQVHPRSIELPTKVYGFVMCLFLLFLSVQMFSLSALFTLLFFANDVVTHFAIFVP